MAKITIKDLISESVKGCYYERNNCLLLIREMTEGGKKKNFLVFVDGSKKPLKIEKIKEMTNTRMTYFTTECQNYLMKIGKYF